MWGLLACAAPDPTAPDPTAADSAPVETSVPLADTCPPGTPASPTPTPTPPDVLFNDSGVVVSAAVGGDTTPIPYEPFTYGLVLRSPDRRRFALSADAETHVYAAAGGAPVATLAGGLIHWIDDATLLVHRTRRTPSPPDELYLAPADGAPATLLYAAPGRALFGFAASPDGARVAFQEADVSGGGFVMGAIDVVSVPIAEPSAATRAPSGLVVSMASGSATQLLGVAFSRDERLLWSVGDVVSSASADLSCVSEHPSGEGIAAGWLVPWVGDDELLWLDLYGDEVWIVGADGVLRERHPTLSGKRKAFALSPDRSRMVYATGVYPEPPVWTVAAPDGADAQVQTWSVDGVGPEW